MQANQWWWVRNLVNKLSRYTLAERYTSWMRAIQCIGCPESYANPFPYSILLYCWLRVNNLDAAPLLIGLVIGCHFWRYLAGPMFRCSIGKQNYPCWYLYHSNIKYGILALITNVDKVLKITPHFTLRHLGLKGNWIYNTLHQIVCRNQTQ